MTHSHPYHRSTYLASDGATSRRPLWIVNAVLALSLTISSHGYAQDGHAHRQETKPVMSAPNEVPSQPGQSAFAAIQEIVDILDADPKTDWQKVNIEALRQHLIDMDNVTLHSQVQSEPAPGGMRFHAYGTGPVINSIQRMVTAHAATMNLIGSWKFAALTTSDGAILTVTVPAGDIEMLHGLGFIGVMAREMHHQEHHLIHWEFPRLCRGGSRSLTFPGVCPDFLATAL